VGGEPAVREQRKTPFFSFSYEFGQNMNISERLLERLLEEEDDDDRDDDDDGDGDRVTLLLDLLQGIMLGLYLSMFRYTASLNIFLRSLYTHTTHVLSRVVTETSQIFFSKSI
jgi:hypothetical protein